MVNKAILIGRLGKDPDVKYTPDGTMVTSFSLATVETYKDKNGDKVQKTEWHRIVAWGKKAEVCGEYLKKGSQVFIEGKIETKSYEDKEGVRRYQTQIIAGNIEFLSSRKESGEEQTFDGPPIDDVPF